MTTPLTLEQTSSSNQLLVFFGCMLVGFAAGAAIKSCYRSWVAANAYQQLLEYGYTNSQRRLHTAELALHQAHKDNWNLRLERNRAIRTRNSALRTAVFPFVQSFLESNGYAVLEGDHPYNDDADYQTIRRRSPSPNY